MVEFSRRRVCSVASPRSPPACSALGRLNRERFIPLAALAWMMMNSASIPTISLRRAVTIFHLAVAFVLIRSRPSEVLAAQPFHWAADGLSGVIEGCVRLHADETDLVRSFDRFDDEVNGVSAAKITRVGQFAEIVDVFRDRTMTCKFADGVLLDFPFESAATQVPCEKMSADALMCVDTTIQCSMLHDECDESWVRKHCRKTCSACLSEEVSEELPPIPMDIPVASLNDGDMQNAGISPQLTDDTLGCEWDLFGFSDGEFGWGQLVFGPQHPVIPIIQVSFDRALPAQNQFLFAAKHGSQPHAKKTVHRLGTLLPSG